MLHSCTCHCIDTPCYLYSVVFARILYNAGEEACDACNRIATGLAGAGKIDGNCCIFIHFLCVTALQHSDVAASCFKYKDWHLERVPLGHGEP